MKVTPNDTSTSRLPVVDFHTHYAGPNWPAHAPVNSPAGDNWSKVAAKVADIDRLTSERRAAGITLSALSAPPALLTRHGQQLTDETISRVNDHLATVVEQQTGVTGLATVDAYTG
jgi:hypothetical protein